MTRLLFVRHGQTVHNSLGEISTLPPGGPLSDLGVEQAQELATVLAPRPIAAVYASPMERAVHTAEIIAGPHALPVQPTPELTEVSAGELDGRADAEAYALLNSALDTWCQGDLNVRIGRSGELGRDVVRRLTGLVADLADRHPGQTLVLVSHGGLLQTGIPWVCANLSPAFGLRRLVANTAVIELQADDAGVTCLSWAGAPVTVDADAPWGKLCAANGPERDNTRSGGVTEMDKLRIGLLVSGQGSVLRTLLRVCGDGSLPGQVVAVASNRECPALRLAREGGVGHVAAYPVADYASRAERDARMAAGVNFVVVGSYSEALEPGFFTGIPRDTISMYPALLPAFGELDEAIGPALEAGVKVIGVTIHFRTPLSVSAGPIIAQEPLPVDTDDTVESVTARVIALESEFLPRVLRAFSEGRVVRKGERVRVLEPAAG